MFRHEVEKITPEIAKIYYSRSTGNRVINRQAVKTYIAQMKTGRWVLNGETICFDSNGVLRDGHHRLLAIIESGVTIEVLVVRGVDPAAWYTYDQGKSRSGGDIFQIAGVTNPFAIKAIVAKCEAINEKKILHSINNAQYTSKSNAELLGIYKEHEEVFRDALSMYLKYQTDFRRLLSPAYIGGVAAFLMLYKGCTKECVGRFWEGFALGILPAYKQARMALTVASGSKAIMQIVYSAWYAYEHDNITEDFVMIEGSFV